MFHQKVLKNVWLAQGDLEFALPLVQVMPSLEKLHQVLEARSEQQNLQPTLSKRAGNASLTILCLIVSKIKQKIGNGFLKTQKNFFKKVVYL